MKITLNILKDAFLYWLQIAIFIWPAFLLGNGFFALIVYFIFNSSCAQITEIASSILILCVLLFIFAYKRAYKRIEFHGIRLLISMLLAAGLQLLYARLFRFAVYTGAGAHYLALYLYVSTRSVAYYEVPASLYIASMLAVYPLYIISVMLGEYLGKKKRLQDRDDLTKKIPS